MLRITDGTKTHTWWKGTPLVPPLEQRTVTIQADGDELALILEAMRDSGRYAGIMTPTPTPAPADLFREPPRPITFAGPVIQPETMFCPHPVMWVMVNGSLWSRTCEPQGWGEWRKEPLPE